MIKFENKAVRPSKIGSFSSPPASILVAASYFQLYYLLFSYKPLYSKV